MMFTLPDLRSKPVVTITKSAMLVYRQTIARHPPETFALLGGSLEHPFHITDFRFCPPRRANGRYDRSRAHVNVDHEYMNFVVDEEFKPNNKYMLGLWHSHPGSSGRPSNGDEEVNEGDMVFFRSCLLSDDSDGKRWRHFLAPITTFAVDGADTIHMWIVTADSSEPLPAQLIEIDDECALAPVAGDAIGDNPGLSITPILQLLRRYDAAIEFYRRPDMSRKDRNSTIRFLRNLRRREQSDILAGTHPLGKYTSAQRPEHMQNVTN